jgi:hypothetical protein
MLSWRVPTSGDPRLLRLALAQVGLASVVAGLILLVAVPREWLGPALFGLIPLAIFMAYRRWHAYQRSMDGGDNVRLNERGLHWLDTRENEQGFNREEVVAFHIGRDGDTLRPVPALTLHLKGGFESQPIELHPPATSDVVRRVLTEDWHLRERDQPMDSAGHYDMAFAIYGECHEEFQEWHWEGAGDELTRFFALFAVVADELPLPPLGAKPLSRIVLLTRRDPTRLRLSRDRHPYLDQRAIAAPADILRNISAQAIERLTETPRARDLKFDVPTNPQGVWTFHVHVIS